MKLYFVRHGRTLWNLEGRFQGASGDSPLLPESIDILKQLGQYLKDIPLITRAIHENIIKSSIS